MCLLTKLKQKKSDARKTTTANSSKKIKLVKVRLKKKFVVIFKGKIRIIIGMKRSIEIDDKSKRNPKYKILTNS